MSGEVITMQLNKSGVDLGALRNNKQEQQAAPLQEQPQPAPPQEFADSINVVPSPIEQPPEDIVEKRKLITKIQSYQMSERLSKYIKHLGIGDLESKTVAELNDTLREVQYCCGIRSNGRFWYNAFINAVGGAEFLMINNTNLKVTGLQQTIAASEEAKDLVEEISLKHQSLVYIQPEARLGLLLLQTTIMLHQVNAAKDEANKFLSASTSESVVNKYSDI